MGDDHADQALREVLLEATKRLGQSQYRSLLKIVLGLEEEYAGLSAAKKRAIAGQKFRGGQRPVSGGTIRQHHEPKALAELAEILFSSEQGSPRPSGERPSDPGAPDGELIEWHPGVRAAWARERLAYWRVSLRDYDWPGALQKSEQMMQSIDASSWAVYEIYGSYDLLYRVWLPSQTTVADFERALIENFGASLDLFDGFTVDEIVSHWPWALGESAESLPVSLREPVPDLELDRLDQAQRKTMLASLREKNLIAQIQPGTGIGFIVAVTASRPALSASFGGRPAVQERLREILAQAPGSFTETSLFRGSGFADYLLQGRIRGEDFPLLKQSLIDPLNEFLESVGYRTYTFLMSTANPVAFREEMPGKEVRRPTKARALLESGESPKLEVLGSALNDIRRKRSDRDAQQAVDTLMRIVTGFLNSDGGTILIGAFEKDALNRDPRFEGLSELRGAPEIGAYVVPGIDHELKEGSERFLRRIRSSCRQLVEPDPGMYVSFDLEQVNDRTVCLVKVGSPSREGHDQWFYFTPRSGLPRFVVRVGDQTSELRGADADRYKIGKAHLGLG